MKIIKIEIRIDEPQAHTPKIKTTMEAVKQNLIVDAMEVLTKYHNKEDSYLTSLQKIINYFIKTNLPINDKN